MVCVHEPFGLLYQDAAFSLDRNVMQGVLEGHTVQGINAFVLLETKWTCGET